MQTEENELTRTEGKVSIDEGQTHESPKPEENDHDDEKVDNKPIWQTKLEGRRRGSEIIEINELLRYYGAKEVYYISASKLRNVRSINATTVNGHWLWQPISIVPKMFGKWNE